MAHLPSLIKVIQDINQELINAVRVGDYEKAKTMIESLSQMVKTMKVNKDRTFNN
jgi:hypothetical protein